jgi:O-antigen/teichoic acid export membrane protein
MLNALDHGLAMHLASRLLAPLPTGLFLAAHCIMLATTPASAYLRAHKKEPLMVFSIIYAALVGCSTFFLGRHFSVMGMAAGYLIVNALAMPVVFLIWSRCRKEWHAN